ncbi:MAG: hypothetical protein BJ554DRAFT_1317 [Olpidium bornovanus]|uniref:Uncharacterized protein n=1 Tax=Olpidium bornovanus TaxID=278681 RepID=A0A8H8DHJ6_9FUNG|nr:MAG: hypothetical protein BJ554DRAFT_1317 [Olpidium bornovanus]
MYCSKVHSVVFLFLVRSEQGATGKVTRVDEGKFDRRRLESKRGKAVVVFEVELWSGRDAIYARRRRAEVSRRQSRPSTSRLSTRCVRSLPARLPRGAPRSRAFYKRQSVQKRYLANLYKRDTLHLKMIVWRCRMQSCGL